MDFKEFNDYSIKNPDGYSEDSYGSQKIEIDNSDPNFISENTLQDQDELFKVSETFNDPLGTDGNSSTNVIEEDTSNIGLSSEILDASTSAASVVSTATTVASVTTTVGGGIGALAGIMGTGFVAAALLVVAFISTLTVNLKLVMAGMNTITVEVEMRGAQDEDFDINNPIIAVLSGEDGTYQEQYVYKDSRYLSFTGLYPNTEYLISIKRGGETLDSKSYITTSENIYRGEIFAYNEASHVYIFVSHVLLESRQIYTVLVKNAQGDIMFARDDELESAEYNFIAEEETKLYLSLSIDGETISVCELEIRFDQYYDLENGVWDWSDDYSTAKVTFHDLSGGSDLVLEANITKTEVSATCEEDAYILYTAEVEYEGNTYSDHKSSDIYNSALGHEYGELISEVSATCDSEGISAHYECSRCGKYFDINKNEADYNDLIIPALGHEYGDLITEVSATCESDGIKAHYECAICGKYFDTNKYEVSYDSLIIPALGHDYGELIPEVPADYDNNGMMAHYKCSRCGKYFDANKNETTYDALVIPALGHELGELIPEVAPNCEESGIAAHYICSDCGKYFDINKNETTLEALTIPPLGHEFGEIIQEVSSTCLEEGLAAHYVCSHCGKYFDANKYETTLEELRIAPTGHDYGEPEFEWIANDDGFYEQVIVRFVCLNDSSHVEEFEIEPEVNETPPTCEADAILNYYASIEFEGEEYFEEKEVVIEESAYGHEYEPVFEWVQDNDGFYISATLKLVCIYDSSHVIIENAEIVSEEVEETCEEDGYIVYTAMASYDNEEYFDEKYYVFYDTALGHEYGQPVFNWSQVGEEVTCVAIFTCTRDSNHVLEVQADVEQNGEMYIATVQFEQEEYQDVHGPNFEP